MKPKWRNTRSKEIDLALDVTRTLMRPGDRLSTRALAEICGCTNTAIYLIEKKALRKVREALRRKLGLNYAQLATGRAGEL